MWRLQADWRSFGGKVYFVLSWDCNNRNSVKTVTLSSSPFLPASLLLDTLLLSHHLVWMLCISVIFGNGNGGYPPVQKKKKKNGRQTEAAV
jgi:hypothetical protein